MRISSCQFCRYTIITAGLGINHTVKSSTGSLGLEKNVHRWYCCDGKFWCMMVFHATFSWVEWTILLKWWSKCVLEYLLLISFVNIQFTTWIIWSTMQDRHHDYQTVCLNSKSIRQVSIFISPSSQCWSWKFCFNHDLYGPYLLSSYCAEVHSYKLRYGWCSCLLQVIKVVTLHFGKPYSFLSSIYESNGWTLWI